MLHSMVREAGPAAEGRLRAWLARRGIIGEAEALLVWERSRYPPFMTAAAGDLIAAQYADRPGLRPTLDTLLQLAHGLGPDVKAQARKRFVTLVARRPFAVVRASTRSRVDLGLRLADAVPDGRSLLNPGSGLGASTVRVALTAPTDLDRPLVDLLRAAYRQNR